MTVAFPGLSLPLQLGATVLSAVLLLVPPRSGAILLIPLDAHGAARTFNLALARGALPVASGPWGSIVVRGERHRLLPLLAHGIVPTAAPRGWCGA